jgi:predicted unusual protein kinase regulating ubiquinone biosynthesis (AarF/ABC1/UbiB family)
MQSQATPLFNPTNHSTNDSTTAASAVATTQDFTAINEQLKSAAVRENEDEIIEYDPEAIAAYYGQKPLQVWVRTISIFWAFFSFFVSLWWDRQTKQLQKNQLRRAVQLRETLTHLGPAYIKIGQAISTRPDLVPPTYLEELALLQDQLPPFANEVAFQFIEEELGDRPENIYAELSPNPVAAASLGQVYKGKLKTGETVAVKVQRPDLAQRIGLDIYILRQLSIWATKSIKRLRSDLVGIMDEFGARIYEEMDYTHEGHNAERFAQLYGHLKDIYVPRIYWQYTQRRVLTMEWIIGTKLTQSDKIRDQGTDPAYLIEVGVQCSLRQLLEHGFFHADPHPGNLLATPDGKLAYLDFGMMSEVKSYQRYGLIEAVVHMVNRDFEGLAYDYVKLEFLSPDTDLSPIIPALGNVFGNALGASVAELNFKSITDQLSELMYEYPFRVPAYYALIIRSLVTLEGIAINIDPNFKVLSKAYPYVAKRLLTDPAPELRHSLRDLLFKDGSFRWNRLENLLRNARNSQDYDLNQAFEQSMDFLFSERGELIREHLATEIVKGLDAFGQTTVYRLTSEFRRRVGLNGAHLPVDPEQPASVTHIVRIIDILRDTPGFDLLQLIPLVPRVLFKPETHRLGQQITIGLAQRAAARLIRQLLLQEQPESMNGKGYNHKGDQPKQSPEYPRLALPAGR